MARIKITGYVDTDNLDEEHIDLQDASGLSALGYETLVLDIRGRGEALTLANLEDVDAEVEQDGSESDLRVADHGDIPAVPADAATARAHGKVRKHG